MILWTTWIVLILITVPILLTGLSIFRAQERLKRLPRDTFFLSHSFFISLVVMAYFWVILLMLLGSLSLLQHELPLVSIIICTFAPFFCWWRQKRYD